MLVRKTIYAFTAGALLAASAPALADHDRYRGYHPQRHGRAVVVERPVYVERKVVVERPVYVDRPVYVERPAPVYYPEYDRYPAYEPAYERPGYGYEPVAVGRPHGGIPVATVAGAAIGAMIGSQVGDRHSRGATAAIGAVIGGVLGSQF